MKKFIIAGNWKMNLPDIEEFAANMVPVPQGIQAVICPPFPYILSALNEIRDRDNFSVGGQDVSRHESGAYTGEVSAGQLYDIGAEYVIIGHSERRQYHGETDEDVNVKTFVALSKKLTPIVCIGETLLHREEGKTETIIKRQLIGGFKDLTADQAALCVVAYEPVWAIGTGVSASPEDAQAVCKYVKEVLGELYDEHTAGEIPVLYGGSMTPENGAELLSQPDIQGGLIGGASLKAESFSAIIKIADEINKGL